MKKVIYKIAGRVVKGEKLGSELGFPTANLSPIRKLPGRLKMGVYFGLAELPSGKKFRSGIVIGPLDKKRRLKIEAHLLGFKGDLYGKVLKLDLIKYLRPFKNYRHQQALVRQIEKDVLLIKSISLRKN